MQGDDLDNTFYGVLYKLDETDGTIIWQKQYDYFQEDSTQHYFYGMNVCLDGGLVMAGMVRDLRPGESPGNSMWVVKTDCLGNDSIWDNACDFTIGLEEIEKNALFNLYPNPSTGAVTLDYFIPQNTENQSISFYNATGKLVQKVDFTGEGQIQLNIDCSGFSNGVYQCVLVSDGEVLQQGRLVLIK
jgi:outer membrane protein assembly factor BamB